MFSSPDNPSCIEKRAAFTRFISQYALQSVTLSNGARWRYYDAGPKDGPTPLIFVHGTSGTCRVFFYQLASLASKGYRAISVQLLSPAWTHREWGNALDRLLDHLKLQQAHFYGVSLGGFLLQSFAATFPDRVISLALTNAFCDTSVFNSNAPCVGAFPLLPEFYLKKYVLDNFPKAALIRADIADAINFQVSEFETLGQEEIASRLTLNCIVGDSVILRRAGTLRLPQERITMIDSFDDVALPSTLQAQLFALYPRSCRAGIKRGGDFAYLSCHDEVTMHLIVHLRRNGAEPADCHAVQE